MAAPTNLVTSQVAVGNREDLEDTIYRVAPEETPFVSAIGKAKATARYHSWQTQALANPDATNAALEGGNVGNLNAPNITARPGNFCQIFTKTYGVSRTQEVVDKAGRKSEINFQKLAKGIEIRRDMEARFVGNYASADETAGPTPRYSAGILAFLTSNTSKGAGGADGGFSAGVVTAATNGTLRNFSEALLKSTLQAGFTAGAKPTIAMMGGVLKQEFSGFAGVATNFNQSNGKEQATIVAGASVYVSDFGNLMLKPHPYALSRDCALINPDYAKVATLDGIRTEPLAKSGDSDQFLMTWEACLVCNNEKAHEVVRDVQ